MRENCYLLHPRVRLGHNPTLPSLIIKGASPDAAADAFVSSPHVRSTTPLARLTPTPVVTAPLANSCHMLRTRQAGSKGQSGRRIIGMQAQSKSRRIQLDHVIKLSAIVYNLSPCACINCGEKSILHPSTHRGV